MACNVIDRAIQVHGARGHQRRLPAGPAVRLAPRDAAVRRARRGAHAHHRPRRTRPREVGLRRGGDGVSAVDGGELSGAWNFRDVAEETGIRPGRFFRSSELSRLDDGGRTAMGSSASPTSPTCARCGRSSGAAPVRCPTACRDPPAAVPRTCRRRRLRRRTRRLRADDDREARRRGRRRRRRAVHDRGVPALPDAAGRATRCAPGHFAVGRRASGDHALLRGQGPHRVHGGRWCWRRSAWTATRSWPTSCAATPRSPQLRESILESVRNRAAETPTRSSRSPRPG